MNRFVATFCILCCVMFACAPQQYTLQTQDEAQQADALLNDGFDASKNMALQQLEAFLQQKPPLAAYQVTESEIRIPPLTPVPEQDLSSEDIRTEGVGLNFENADIHDVTKIVSEITGKSFIVDEDVEGMVTIYSERSLSPVQVFELFKSVLELNGLAITQVGEFYKIVKSEKAQKSYLTVDTDPYRSPEDSLVTQIVKLKYVKGRDVKAALQELTSSDIIIYPDENGNTLIITDLASNVRKLLDIIQEMDISQYANRYVEIFPIEHADLGELVDDLYQILAIPGAAGSLDQMAAPPEAPEAEPEAGEEAEPAAARPVVTPGTETSIYPITRMNALMVSTNNPEVLALVRKWVNILDQRSVKDIEEEAAPTERTNYVYSFKYSKAEDLVPILVSLYESVAQEQEEGEGQQPTEEEQPPVFIEDTTTNSLIIRATPTQYAHVASLLEKLDQRPLQVLIDVIIAEVTLSDSDVFGVRGMLQGQDQVTIGGETNTVNATMETEFPGVAGGDGFSYVVTAAGRFLGQLRALATESRVKVLSDPHIMVRNNQEASINIGDSIPITTIRGEGEDTEETVEYRDTGIILRVRPQINLEGDVILEINQEVSTPGTRATGDAAPPINTTTAQTFVMTQDGYPLVIGGLINSRGRNSVQGVPLLKDIPLLGRLFRYNETQNERKELVILVMPRIVRTQEQGWNLTDDVLQKRVKQLEQLFNREETDADKIKRFLRRQIEETKP